MATWAMRSRRCSPRVSSELELAVLAFPSHSEDTLVDWGAFHTSQAASTDEWSSRVGLRSLLSTLAYTRYQERRYDISSIIYF